MSSAIATPLAVVRSSARKRKAVTYYESEDEILDPTFDAEDNGGSPKKKATVARRQKPLPKKKFFPFMRLPAELRNAIYKFALTDSSDHHLVSQNRAHRRVAKRVPAKELNTSSSTTPRGCHIRGNLGRARNRRRNISGVVATTSNEEALPFSMLIPAILRVSRIVYEESIQYLYTNRIVCQDTLTLHSFLTQIGSKHRIMLRDIEVADWGYSAAHKAMNFPAVSLLADALNLEHFQIDIREWGGPTQMAKKVFRDCYAFTQAYGWAKGDKFAALDVIDLVEDCLCSRCFNSSTRTWELQEAAEQMKKFKAELKSWMSK